MEIEHQFAKHTPQFKNPEEELAFLRAKVAENEKEIASSGLEVNKEVITKDILNEYKKINTSDVLHKDNIIHPKDAEGIVLRLKPESHDTKMEELLAILLDKGIKNTLDILEKLNNPHLDDDFHRFLIQYIHSMDKVPGLKEETPLFKALHMVLFEVSLPDPEKNESKSFKEFLGAMEQFYSGMQSVGNFENKEHNYFALEIALSSSSDEVVIYASVPKDRADMFEKQVQAFYHHAKIHEVTDDYNIFSENGYSSGAYAKLADPEVYPIKTYETLEHDPMQTLLNAFTKLKKDGEGASIQFIISPAGDKFIKKFNDILKKVKEGDKVKDIMSFFGKIDNDFINIGKEIFFGKDEKKEEKKVDDNA